MPYAWIWKKVPGNLLLHGPADTNFTLSVSEASRAVLSVGRSLDIGRAIFGRYVVNARKYRRTAQKERDSSRKVITATTAGANGVGVA